MSTPFHHYCTELLCNILGATEAEIESFASRINMPFRTDMEKKLLYVYVAALRADETELLLRSIIDTKKDTKDYSPAQAAISEQIVDALIQKAICNVLMRGISEGTLLYVPKNPRKPH